RTHDSGRHHNGRMGQWEYGKDLDYLMHKSKQARILCSTGSERGTSSRCPRCQHKHKPKGRTWVCRRCGFRGHRDLVGSVNMKRAERLDPATQAYQEAVEQIRREKDRAACNRG